MLVTNFFFFNISGANGRSNSRAMLERDLPKLQELIAPEGLFLSKALLPPLLVG